MKNKLLVILGPTSTGKTDLAINLAKQFNGELVSADSRQVYKYLDIGTGKLPGKFNKLKKEDDYWEIDGVKIRMYDIAQPKMRFNLYEYVLRAEEIINKITESGKLPILVGGTGSYIRSLLEGVSDFGIDENQSLREELENLDINEIRKRINKSSPEVLKKLNNSEINNKRRLIRLLEKLTAPKNPKKSFPGIDNKFDVLKIGLKTDRQILKDKIKKRILSRINQGMIGEAQNLLATGILSYERMEELGLEYRYLAKLLRGEIKSQDEFIEILSLKISQFAKRQDTWFRKEKDVVWFDILNPGFAEQVEKKIADWYNES